MNAGSGNDSVTAGVGDDRIVGGAGDDVLNGGAGQDRLRGGDGADRFVFSSSDNYVSGQRDIVGDFSRAQGDKFDLTAIDANTLLVGDQAFKNPVVSARGFGGSAGELIVYQVGRAFFVAGDTDGDLDADFLLQVITTEPLITSDFNL